MRRKVVQQGPSTMMVSLPMAWVKANGISKGDEMSVEIVDNHLVLSTDTSEKEKTETIVIKDRKEYLDRSIMTKYREGYNKLIVKYDDPRVIDHVRETLRHLLGFEIIDQTARSCTIKNISEGSDEDYVTMFRRLCQIVVTMSESCLEYTKTKDESSLKTAIDLRETLIKLEQFNLRVINRQNNYTVQQKSLEFFYVWQVGGLGKMWSSLAKLCLKEKIVLSKEDVLFMKESVEYTKDFQASFFKRDAVVLLQMKRKLYALRPVGAGLLNTSKNRLVVFYLLRMLNRIYEVTLMF